MADFFVSVEAPASPSTTRSKPKLVVRGLRRRNIKNLMQKLKNQVKDDQRESARADKLGYPPFLFFGPPSSAMARNAAAIITRCEQVLKMKR